MADRVCFQDLNKDMNLIDSAHRVEEPFEETVEGPSEGPGKLIAAQHNLPWINLEGKPSWIFQSMSTRRYVSSLLGAGRVCSVFVLFIRPDHST